MRTITLNPEQQREVEILTRLEAETLDVATAAELPGISARKSAVYECIFARRAWRSLCMTGGNIVARIRAF